MSEQRTIIEEAWENRALLEDKNVQGTIRSIIDQLDVFNNAKRKLKNKKCDYLILNFPFDKDPIFNSKYNNGGILNIKGDYIEIGKKTKTSFANQIIAHILK